MPNNNQQHCMTFKINEDGSHNAAEIADFVKADSWDVNGDKLTLFNLVLVGKAQFSAMNGEDIIISGLNCEQQIEQEIQDKGLNAPRLTPDHIDSVIQSVHYFTGNDGIRGSSGDNVSYGKEYPLSLLTFCVLVLKNGFTVTGESACASPENFDAEIGKKIAYDNAREKIWLLEGYLLKEQLHKQNSKVELKTGIDSLLDTRIPIINQLTDLCYAIEKCGASPELTDAVTKAGALRDPISELVKQALALGIGQGIVSVSYSDNGSHPTPDLPEFKNYDVKSFEPSCSTQACVDGSSSSNGYQLNAKRDNAFLVAQLLSNNKISAELRKKAETKMTALLDELI